MHSFASNQPDKSNRENDGLPRQLQPQNHPGSLFTNNRPEAAIQRKYKEAASQSPQVKQLRSLQATANQSAQVRKTAQLQSIANAKTAQRQSSDARELHTEAVAPVQRKENNTGLPDSLKSGMEDLSGYSLDDVKVHYNSDQPAQMQAHAYAQGSDIHIAPGQEQHLPHEAWHVVQQKQGRVQPTTQFKGKVNLNDDAGLEKEADVMGAKALQMKPFNPEEHGTRAQTPSTVQRSVVQRAIAINNNPVPRSVDIPSEMKQFLNENNLLFEFLKLNDDREIIYQFDSDEHLLNYLNEKVGKLAPGKTKNPTIVNVSQQELEEGHSFAQQVRFSNIYQPSPNQISQNAPGTHNIPQNMMPPPGTGHMWGQVPDYEHGNKYVIYQNQYDKPQHSTLPLTYGDPQSPSLIMNQNGLNLGMHIQPTRDNRYFNHISRSQTTYGGNLTTEQDRVRGHPYRLLNTQISTDDPKMNFDNDKRAYTNESDSTKQNGGISTWRSNKVETYTYKNQTSFTQINNNPVMSGMGCVNPSSMHFRVEQPGGTFDDMCMDNTGTTDYRNTDHIRPNGVAKQEYQSQMGRDEIVNHPYPEPEIYQHGQDFAPIGRHNYPGYMSPPPSPFLGHEDYAPVVEEMWINRDPEVGSRVDFKNGETGRVTRIIRRDLINNKTKCEVKRVFETKWPKNFK
ncbi:MAG: DUF4157 domain-containing protein [Bacteroidia bacterium]|nr:DUF4157 domain-containing protein [Bacteroidia bacterium]